MLVNYLEMNSYCAKNIIEIQNESNLFGKENINDILNDENMIYVGAFKHFFLVGFVAYKHLDSTLEIYKIAVLKKYQNQGIGYSLLNFIEKKNKKSTEIIASFLENNNAALQIFKNKGYQYESSLIIDNNNSLLTYKKQLR